jgi:tyrosyl-tRNA synthetase
MKITLSREVSNKLPDYQIGIVVITGIENHGEINLSPQIGSSVADQISAWEMAARKIGINSQKFPQANKNLIKRFLATKKLSSVNPIIDLANFYSLETGFPIGVHDLAKINSDISVRPGEIGDTYTQLNQTLSEKVVDPLVYATGNVIMTRNWTWRLSETTKVNFDTHNIIVFVDVLNPATSEQVVNLTKKLAQDIISRFGGKLLEEGVLNSAHSEMEIKTIDSKPAGLDPRIEEVLTRGVANIIPGRSELEKVLTSGKKLNIYLGIDATATRIHLGHAVPLRKIQTLVELGHNVTFLIGDFTALIGDTSDKDSERPILTQEQISDNFRTYEAQASKILDFSKIKVVFNSEWLGKLNFADIIKLTRHFTLNDFISRELIKKRLTENRSVSLPEVLYPIMQGYDSYHLDTDIQVGGTDQTFNMQAGRTLQKDLRNKDSSILSLQFLEGTDGRKMSKSWGNAIWIADEPDEMYGKVMSLKDELIIQYFTLGTRIPLSEISAVSSRLQSGENPLHLKQELALAIVSELHSKTAAEKAAENFRRIFQQHEIPENISEMTAASKDIVDILVQSKFAVSKSEARRLIQQGGVSYSGRKITSTEEQLTETGVLKVGSRRIVKILI